MAQAVERFPVTVDQTAYEGEPLAVSAGVLDPEQEMEPPHPEDEHDDDGGTHSPPYDQVCTSSLSFGSNPTATSRVGVADGNMSASDFPTVSDHGSAFHTSPLAPHPPRCDNRSPT